MSKKNKKSKSNIEKHQELLVLAIFAVFFLMGMKLYSTNVLDNEVPAFFYARDAFWAADMAVTFDDQGKFDHLSSYSTYGKTDATFDRPPMFPVLSVAIANFTGITPVNAGFHLMLLCIILFAACIYVSIRAVDKNVAFLSLPAFLLIFKFPFSAFATWGHWFSGLNMVFVFAGLLSFLFIKEKKMWVVFGIVYAAGMLTHVRETFYFTYFFGIFFLIQFLLKKLDLDQFKATIKGGVFGGILSIGFMPLILFRLMEGSTEKFFRISYRVNGDTPLFSSLGFYSFILLAGLLIGLYIIYKKKNEKLSGLVVYGGVFWLFSYLGFYSGHFQKFTSQQRYFWPFALAIFGGLAIHQAYKWVLNNFKTKKKHSELFLILLVFALMFLVYNNVNTENNPYIYMFPPTMESFEWIKANTAPEAHFLSLYGDNLYGDAIFWMSKRKFDWVQREDYINKLQSGTISPVYKLGGSEAYKYEKRTGLFTWEFVDNSPKNKTLCEYDYIYMNRASANQVLTQYTGYIVNKLVQEYDFQVVYVNDLAAVIKNNNVGGDCFEKEKIIQG